MSTQNEMNAYLHRTIKSGKQYDSLFPKSNCKSTFTSNGDTYYTMSHIKSVITKYRDQVAQFVNKELKKVPFEKVAAEIYKFQYNHFQYAADGYNQEVRSPQCSWASRKTGVDCKSFSVFAGACLSVLGLKFYIRKINTNPEDPKDFSHVYIVVPKDQKMGSLANGHYTIDGTTHTNTEGYYSSKHDVYMNLPHYTLNGRGPKTAMRRLNGTISSTAMQGLEGFSNYLLGVGVAAATVQAINLEIQNYLNQGINPAFAIVPEGVVVNNKLFRFTSTTGRSAVALNDPIAYIETQLGISSNGRSQQPQSQSSDGETVAQVANAVLQSGFLDSTFGAVFANGFDLSCWGSSMSPTKAKDKVNKVLNWLIQTSNLQTQTSIASLNRFLVTSAVLKSHFQIYTQSKYAKCTRDGGRLGVSLLTAYENKIIAATNNTLRQNNIELDGNTTVSLPAVSLRVPAWNQTLNRSANSLTAKAYTSTSVNSNVSIPVTSVPVNNTVDNVNIGVDTTTGGYRPTGNDIKDKPTDDTVNTASTSTIIGVIALAAGAYYMYEQNKGKTSKKSK